MVADSEAAARAVHEALGGYLDENEIAIRWALTIEVVGPEGVRYLAHRSGGGSDGTDTPMVWEVLGLVRCNLIATEQQLADWTRKLDEDGEESDDGESD